MEVERGKTDELLFSGHWGWGLTCLGSLGKRQDPPSWCLSSGWAVLGRAAPSLSPPQQGSSGEGRRVGGQGCELEPQVPEAGGNALTFSLRTGGHRCTQMYIIICRHVHVIF